MSTSRRDSEAELPSSLSFPAADVSSDLPFLVTHWLSNFSSPDNNNNAEAVRRVQRAATELASAFTSLGAFGTTIRPFLSAPDSVLLPSASEVSRPATYADARRNWSTLPPDHLEHLLQSSLSVSQQQQKHEHSDGSTNLLQQAHERVVEQLKNPANGGRTLQDAIDVETHHSESKQQASMPTNSVLQRPALLGRDDEGTETAPKKDTKHLAVVHRKLYTSASDHMRQYLTLKNKFRQDEHQIHTIQRSLEHNRQSLHHLERERASVLQTNSLTVLNDLDEIKENEQNCHRVIAQLERQLSTLTQTHSTDSKELEQLQQISQTSFRQVQHVMGNFSQPPSPAAKYRYENRILFNVYARQTGMDRLQGRHVPRPFGGRGTGQEIQKALTCRRLSHVVTINTHLSYPVYCLRFDRTGNYFISGADDFLVRVFRVGNVKVNRDANMGVSSVRGAILVCTLRGHAGVINNIDVSPDNAFLATVSDDGDCRVWGLKDGSPVAILRGHVNGAATVAWSATTPYRLMTAGNDGLARIWDIREACLKRYGKVIGKRPEYRLRLANGEKISEGSTRSATNSQAATSDATASASASAPAPAVALPPLPVRQPNGPASGEGVPAAVIDAVPLPPLPPGANDIAAEQVGNNNEDNAVPGDFVVNDNLDEGVKLLQKLQHGTLLEDQLSGPGTRARRKAVRVLCVARCPYGGHFATGSEDGVCRIWGEDEDSRVELVDKKLSDFPDILDESSGRNVRRPGQLLVTLKGHLSAITDLQYSYKGDRLLSASQKDGVVRIWSWATDPVQQSPSSVNRQTSHILIKLSNPSTLEKIGANQASRRRPNSKGASTRISCDVATWVSDDSKVVTSQCELEKQNRIDILPGSQYIFLWDSYTGNCLLGISNGHTMPCPVVISHPNDPTILCSAGADGLVKLWDWSTGECVSVHKNTLQFGPMDPRDRGKPCGYLDGSFSPDGTALVLTDDSGRVTVFDVGRNQDDIEGTIFNGFSWVNEQYFSNDYYDLHYDQNGYCVERGSELPPHLAPRGVRCTNAGIPWSESINDAFRGLAGPIPISEQDARWNRQYARSMCSVSRKRLLPIKANTIGQFDSHATILFSDAGELSLEKTENHDRTMIPRPASERNGAESTHRMSNNYRWRDYSDLLREEGADDDEAELDADDEDFEVGGRVLQESSDSESEMEAEYIEPSRSSGRQRRRSQNFESDAESDDDGLVEYMSTNNTPSGPFVADYESHHFRLSGSRARSLERDWVRRRESSSSYGGRKSYTPQVGDSVVYIPRAHYDTIKEFPTLDAPWQSWPDEAVWPVVRCNIRNIRYRFPFKAYQLRGIVAILTLEITGIPPLSNNRDFEWPKPSFIAPTRTKMFEVCLFENEESDFIIPLGLYTWRLEKLEEELRRGSRNVKVEAYYAGENMTGDDEWVSYEGVVKAAGAEQDSGIGDPHLCGSGYKSISVLWNSTRTFDNMSPWELNLSEAADEPDRPNLTDESKKHIRDALRTVRELADVENFFLYPVDQARYSDYGTRIEVPMDLSFIVERLEADYYSNVLSVISDVKLITENCVKYNGENDEISHIAKNMLAKFEECVLDEAELQSYRKFQEDLATHAQTSASHVAADVPLPDSSTGGSAVRRSSRVQRTRTAHSALENLPNPESSRQRRSSRSREQARATRENRRRPQRYETRSVLDVSPPRQPRTLEDMSNSSRRGRSIGTTGGMHRVLRSTSGAVDQNVHNTRASTRTALGASRQEAIQGRSARSNTRTSLSERSLASRGQIRSSGRATRARGDVVSYADQPSDVDEQSEAHAPVESGSELNGYQGAQSQGISSRESRVARRSLRGLAGSSRSHVAETNNTEAAQEQPLTRTARRTRRQSLQEEGDSSSDGSEEIVASSSRRRSQRSTRRSSTQVNSCEEESYEEEEEEEGEEQSASEHEEEEENEEGQDEEESGELPSEAESDEESASRRKSLRTRATAKRYSPDITSSPAVRGGRKRVRREDPSRKSPRKHTAATKSYLDPSSSEFDESESEEESTAGPVSSRRASKARNSATKRKSNGAARSPPRKKPKNAALETLEELEPWPEIDIKKITPIANTILDGLRNFDLSGIFAEPVIETYPELKNSYLSHVKEPMDFRTIEEDRLPRYRSIRELQQDLVLTFSNCLAFNQEENEFTGLARLLHGALREIFVQACLDHKVRLPREWKR